VKTTPTSTSGVPEAFIQRFGRYVSGFLSGFDRLRFHGTLRMLFQPEVTETWLLRQGVLVKDFKPFVQELTQRIKALAKEAVDAAGRPFR
jgi:hypothetical protein